MADLARQRLGQGFGRGPSAAALHALVHSDLQHAARAEERHALVAPLDAASYQPDTGPRGSFVRILKDLTLVGFFTSRIGATQSLAYEAVPGGYRGCLELRPGQKAWAT